MGAGLVPSGHSFVKSSTTVEFLDSNILIYAASGLAADAARSAVARSLVAGSNLAISLQVLQEFYNVARKPKKLAFSHAEALRYLDRWRRFTVLEPTLALFDSALVLCDRFQITYYDAGILAAARMLHCSVVYSEDLNDGQDYDGVRVVNPFRHL